MVFGNPPSPVFGSNGKTRAFHVLERERVVVFLRGEFRIVAAEDRHEDAIQRLEVRGLHETKLIAIDRARDRAAHFDVVERRHLDVHHLAADRRDLLVRAERPPPRIALVAKRVRQRELAVDVDLALFELEPLRDEVHRVSLRDRVEPRLVRFPPTVEANDAEPASAIPRRELERPRAARLPRVVVLVARRWAHGPERLHRERGEKRRVRLAQPNRQDALALHRHAREAIARALGERFVPVDAFVDRR